MIRIVLWISGSRCGWARVKNMHRLAPPERQSLRRVTTLRDVSLGGITCAQSQRVDRTRLRVCDPVGLLGLLLNSVFLFYPPCHRLLRLTPSMPRIPDLPGLLVQHNSDQERWLKRHVASLCKIDNERYVALPSPSYGRTITSSRLLASLGASPSASPQRTWTS